MTEQERSEINALRGDFESFRSIFWKIFGGSLCTIAIALVSIGVWVGTIATRIDHGESIDRDQAYHGERLATVEAEIPHIRSSMDEIKHDIRQIREDTHRRYSESGRD